MQQELDELKLTRFLNKLSHLFSAPSEMRPSWADEVVSELAAEVLERTSGGLYLYRCDGLICGAAVLSGRVQIKGKTVKSRPKTTVGAVLFELLGHLENEEVSR